MFIGEAKDWSVKNKIHFRRIRVGEKYKPGEIAKESGQYPIVGPRGGDTGKERTVVKGEPFPPTPKLGQTYGTPDKTKH